MDSNISNAIKTILDEIKKKLEIVDKNNNKSSLEELNYKSIIDIFKNKTDVNIKDIDADELILLTKDELVEVLEASGKGTKDTEDFSSNFEFFKKEFLSDDFERKEKARNALQRMISDIKLFVLDYEEINKNRSDYNNSLYDKLKYYHDLFSGKKKDDLVVDFDDIDLFLTTLGVSTEVKWRALEYLALNNLKLTKKKEKTTRFENKMEIANELVKNNPIITDKIVAALDNIDYLDIDLIPELAKEISITTKLEDISTIQNIVTTLVLNTLFEQLKYVKSDEEKNEKMQEIYDTYLFYVNDKDIILNVANDIIEENIYNLNEIDEEIDLDSQIAIVGRMSKIMDEINKKEVENESVELQKLEDLIYHYKKATQENDNIKMMA